MSKTPPQISKTLFWEVDLSKIDFDLRARYVIERVVMYGNWRDWQEIKRYYGLEKIKEEMLKVRYLDDKTLNFLSIYFDVPKENFRCHVWKEMNRIHWDF